MRSFARIENDDKDRPQKRIRLSMPRDFISKTDIKLHLINTLHRILNIHEVATLPYLDGIDGIAV